MLRALLVTLALAVPAASAEEYTLSAKSVEVYDYAELTVRVPAPKGQAFVTPFGGTFTPKTGGPSMPVQGFVDDEPNDIGLTYRLRVMPTVPGEYVLTAGFPERSERSTFTATLTATPSTRKGVLRVDPEHPYHFQWAGTGEHFFLNGTTAYWLLGNSDDADIRAAIDRFATHKITRIRVALNGRTTGGERWFEPKVTDSDKFRFNLQPWPTPTHAGANPSELDTARYNVPFWRKCERMLRYARDRDIAVSIIFHLDGADPGVDPFNGGKKTLPDGKPYLGSDAERAYYRYGAARLGAFANVMWDVTNEWHLFRDPGWVKAMATVLRDADPYRHPISVHANDKFVFRAEPWADFCSYQVWDGGDRGAGLHMRRMRAEQAATGRGKPQVNEEYGYEDHYPGKWGGGKVAPARNADSRRRIAWEITMAGGYQTTGERADTGAGGWISGRGDASMNLLKRHAHLTTFFTSFDWWKCDPAAGVAPPEVAVLAEKGKRYVMYAPKGGTFPLRLPAGEYTVRQFNPRTGEWGQPCRAAADAEVWFADDDDWALVAERR